jgi:hypothetical protein
MKRIIVLLTVALVMAVMMLATAMPVLADTSGEQPPGPPSSSGDFDHPQGSVVSHRDEGACVNHFGLNPHHGSNPPAGDFTGGGC